MLGGHLDVTELALELEGWVRGWVRGGVRGGVRVRRSAVGQGSEGTVLLWS